ncbi:hypothetical protein BH11ARM2_BH11ARM2_23960 [soil metagenome]
MGEWKGRSGYIANDHSRRFDAKAPEPSNRVTLYH